MINSTVDPRLSLGRELLAFVDAAVLADADELPVARAVLLERAGPAVVTAVAGVIATFEMMNRILDAIGAPVGGFLVDIAVELDVEIPVHLRRIWR